MGVVFFFMNVFAEKFLKELTAVVYKFHGFNWMLWMAFSTFAGAASLLGAIFYTVIFHKKIELEALKNILHERSMPLISK